MRSRLLIFVGLSIFVGSTLVPARPCAAGEAPVSAATQECLDCHADIHPGIVGDWRKSRHAATTVEAAMKIEGAALKVSAKDIPAQLRAAAVGCAECHLSRGPGKRPDTFEHNGYEIHMVVSPNDCAVCHPVEREQFGRNIMALAEKNLSENALYLDLQRTIMGSPEQKGARVDFRPPDDLTRADACYYCHGTRLTVDGTQTRDTDAGEMVFPIIRNWPNQGVGRLNPDSSRGACSACHTRHQFSIAMARKPYTCKECHVGPDVPAFKVYSASKHGNIFSAMENGWDFDKTPWTIGEDFTAPTCAACHISLTVNPGGAVVNPRTHQMNDRLGFRIFGLIYAHPQPRSPDTTVIRNSAGLALPTDLDGKPARQWLIPDDEIKIRRATMRKTCLACHATGWVEGYFQRLDNTIATSNAEVLVATQILQSAWSKGFAKGIEKGGSIFDEAIERRWSDIWLLYANNIRFVSAMAGGGDYGVFEDGRYHLTRTLLEMQDWMDVRAGLKAK